MSPWSVRRSYAAAGWHLWRRDGYARDGEPCTWYYAVKSDGGRYVRGSGVTVFTISPLATLREVLAHPSMRPA